MRLGTFLPYAQRRFAMSAGQAFGKLVAHETLVKQCLREGVVSGVDIFSSSVNELRTARERQTCEAAFVEAFGADRVWPVFKSLRQLPMAIADGDYGFLSAGPESCRLGQIRWGLDRGDFTITTLIHSVNWRDLFPFYLGTAVTSRPCDAIVVTSAAAESAVRAILAWLRENFRIEMAADLVRIPLGVDLPAAPGTGRERSRALLGLDPSAEIILYLGRLSEEFKADLMPLLRMMRPLSRTHPSARLVLAGQDQHDYAARLRMEAAALDIARQITVIESPAECVKGLLYEASDVFVSPVDNIQESFGIALIEAMAYGLPVVAADWSGYRDIVIHGETGFLFPSYWDSRAGDLASTVVPAESTLGVHQYLARHTILDTEAMTGQVERLLADASLRRRFGAAGRARAEALYGWRSVLAQYRELFARQAAARAAQPPRAGRPLSLNTVFGHYATATLAPGMSVCTTRSTDGASRPARSVQTLARAERAFAERGGDGATLGDLGALSIDDWDGIMALLKADWLRLASTNAAPTNHEDACSTAGDRASAIVDT